MGSSSWWLHQPRSTATAIIAWGLLLAGCTPRGLARVGATPSGTSFSQVELRSSDTHPSITLVAREGDPFSAVAVAVAHDGGAVESTVLAELLLERLTSATAFSPDARPSGTGVVVVTRVGTAEEGARFVAATAEALRRPVTPAEAARVAEHAARLGPLRPFRTPAESALGACTGELGVPGALKPASAADVETFRRGVQSSRQVAFAAVGPRPLLEAASQRLQGTPEWQESSNLEDSWPKSDVIGTARSAGGGPSLSVAIRVPDPARALELADELGLPGSTLSAQLSQMEPPWVIERTVGVVRPRGGCFRLDARLADPAGSRSAMGAAARAAALVSDEAARRAGRGRSSPFSLDRSVLEATDPREAAAIAAWRTLAGKLPGGPLRTLVAFAPDDTISVTAESFASAFATARAETNKLTLDMRSAVEPGQGQVWLLLGTPCSAALETTDDAGGNAVLVRAIARAHTAIEGVRIEPWISGEGTGLLAHGPRVRADEAPVEQTLRIAEALGRALASPIADGIAGTARAETETELGSDAPSLWTTALEALAPGHPSALEPRGTWQSIANLSTRGTEIRRRAFVRGPLRLAVLGNASLEQASVAEQALTRWLRPLREQQSACPRPTPLSAKPGEYWVDAPPDATGSRALVAVSLPLSPSGIPLEAAFTVHLLNRQNGWLERSVRIPGLAPYAAASVLGGSAAAALAVEIALPGHSAKEAVAQVRALFDRLSQGAASAEDLTLATTALLSQRAQAMLDPRYRAVRLWLGRSEPAPPDLAALRRFHQRMLAADRHVVVLTRPRP